jgi:hypothetical protein
MITLPRRAENTAGPRTRRRGAGSKMPAGKSKLSRVYRRRELPNVMLPTLAILRASLARVLLPSPLPRRSLRLMRGESREAMCKRLGRTDQCPCRYGHDDRNSKALSDQPQSIVAHGSAIAIARSASVILASEAAYDGKLTRTLQSAALSAL